MDLEVLKIAANTDNNRNIENRTHVSKLKNSLCGDEMQVELILKNEKILDFGYQGKSCIYCQASASLLSKISINNQKEKLNDLCDKVELYFDDNVKITEKEWISLKKLIKKENINNRTHVSKLKNSLCGDEMQVELILKNGKILDFGYQGKSCVYCQASASLLSKISINNQKEKLNDLCDKAELYFDDNVKITEKDWISLKKLIKKENVNKKDCILLPFKTLKKIVST